MDHENGPQTAAAVFDKWAHRYQEQHMNTGAYQAGFDTFCDLLTDHAPCILDIACGPGNITHYLLQRRPDADILGIDLAPNMISLARNNNPAARFEIMDARHIKALQAGYQGIVCGFCLPYLSRAETATLIGDIAALLLPGGLVYLSTMEGSEAQSGLVHSSQGDALYMHYHDLPELLSALTSHGFTPVYEHHQPYVSGEQAYTDLILIARKTVAGTQPV
jgi:ubiquinone/menaquinone biosynthesis C-methylase UbiE